MPVIVMPMKNARGKSRCGFVVSSTMLTESSKPMIAKNASAAPLTTSANGSPLRVELERSRRLADALAQAPKRRWRMTIKSPDELDAGHARR